MRHQLRAVALAVHRHTGGERNFSTMIPREILEKIRQIELRTNRLVSESTVFLLLQPSVQCRRVSCTVENGNDVNGTQFHRIIEAVRKSADNNLVHCGRCKTKSIGGLRNLVESFLDFDSKFVTQAGALFIIPGHRVFKFQAGERCKNDLPLHALRLFRRSGSSAWTVSHGMPRSGCRRSSSARRSNSAICSGVSLSSTAINSSSMRSTSSRRCASGKRRIDSRISVALTALNLTGIKHFASA